MTHLGGPGPTIREHRPEVMAVPRPFSTERPVPAGAASTA